MNRNAHRAALSAKRMTEGPEESDSEGGEIDIDRLEAWAAAPPAIPPWPADSWLIELIETQKGQQP